MRLKITKLIVAFLFISFNVNASLDSSITSGLKAYDWSPISKVKKVLQYENTKKLTKRSIDQSKIANQHYEDGVSLMKNKEYNQAIEEFKNAMKRYKRAKVSDNALNYVRTNMALCYAFTGNKQDQAVSKRFLGLLTKKIYNENDWSYNIAIAYNKIGESVEAAKILSSIIRDDKNNFQSYVTLSRIYEDSGNEKESMKVIERMQIAEAKLIEKGKKPKKEEKNNNKKTKRNYAGEMPNVTKLIIAKKDDHLQYDKINKIDERSMISIQEGIKEYNAGVDLLANKNYSDAQTKLKNSVKKLSRGKINENGLNFSRANLSIALLASGEKRATGQAKGYLKNLTNKLYKNRIWTYNMAVAHYDYSSKVKGTQSDEYLKKSIDLFKLSIKQDKLFLPAYSNLIYIYRKNDEQSKANRVERAYEDAREDLMKSFSKQEQKSSGLKDPYIFRVNLGTFTENNTPLDLFDESNLISVPIDDNETMFISGLFFNLDKAIEYQKGMKKRGYENCFIVAYKDGESLEF